MSQFRFEYEEHLKSLSPAEQVKEVKQFVLDMMDWNQQTDLEQVYIGLWNYLKDIC